MDRRTVLQVLTAAIATSGLAASQAGEHVHADAQNVTPAVSESPVFFSAEQYELLRTLVQMIMPADGGGGGAIEAGVPEFIDLLARENPDYQRQLSGGLLWLDMRCHERFGKSFGQCSEEQRRELLDQIAYRRNAATDAILTPGIAFFAFLRDLTLDGYFTSRGGTEYLGFRGNRALATFEGCPRPN